jgi:hypothetical protein
MAPVQCSGGYTVQNMPYLGGSPYDKAAYNHLCVAGCKPVHTMHPLRLGPSRIVDSMSGTRCKGSPAARFGRRPRGSRSSPPPPPACAAATGTTAVTSARWPTRTPGAPALQLPRCDEAQVAGWAVQSAFVGALVRRRGRDVRVVAATGGHPFAPRRYDFFFGNPATQMYDSSRYNRKYTAGTAFGWYWVSLATQDRCVPARHQGAARWPGRHTRRRPVGRASKLTTHPCCVLRAPAGAVHQRVQAHVQDTHQRLPLQPATLAPADATLAALAALAASGA